MYKLVIGVFGLLSLSLARAQDSTPATTIGEPYYVETNEFVDYVK